MPKICEVGGSGLLFPVGGDWEANWPRAIKIILYCLGLVWCFLGVAIVSDVFMGAIEKITSRRKRVVLKDGTVRTVSVWNDTVANLTLMALGSSAPEILLSLIELMSNNFYSGELGPSTIVGSAAFNLFMIIAVCVVAIPDGESRFIKDTSVFAITGSCSIFAYLWLLFMLSATSPDLIDLWESIACFLFFPVLVGIAYAADRGMFSKREGMVHDKVILTEVSNEELAKWEHQIREHHGQHLSTEEVMHLIENEHAPAKSRAAHRVGACRAMLGGKRTDKGAAADARWSIVSARNSTSDDHQLLADRRESKMQFVADRYAVLESVGEVRLAVVRKGDLTKTVTVHYKTREGTAKEKSDFEAIEGDLQFEPGEESKHIGVKIIDDTAYEDEEEFYVDISAPKCLSTGGNAILGRRQTCTVVIIDDDEPGVISFDTEQITFQETGSIETLSIQLKRMNGSNGLIGCYYRTEDDTAMAGLDYEASEGNVVFETGQMASTIELQIKSRGRYDAKSTFRVILTAPTGGAILDHTTDGGADSNICTVDIESSKEGKDRIERLALLARDKMERTQIGNANWLDQFLSAFWVNGSREEQAEAALLDWIMHIVSFPWKMTFALVPPTDYMNGWLCFVCSLLMIGGVTAIIGDVAALFGCSLGLPDSITAITFVALGTSLPDTFASKSAAQQDTYADASIGNVTGSNSVNVFLGLGLPWTIGSIYWKIQGPTPEWASKNPAGPVARYPDGGFIVEAGGLGFSVTVFSICATICIATLLVRRRLFGAELGGPKGPKYATAAFLVLLWLIYIALSSWYVVK